MDSSFSESDKDYTRQCATMYQKRDRIISQDYQRCQQESGEDAEMEEEKESSFKIDIKREEKLLI
jgi:hypothetical protein